MILEFLPDAERELLESVERYEAQRSGLGEAFLQEVERISALLLEFPAFGEPIDSIHRRLPLQRFPYGIIFRRDDEVVRIVAVAHRRRNPQYWTPRVQDRAR